MSTLRYLPSTHSRSRNRPSAAKPSFSTSPREAAFPGSMRALASRGSSGRSRSRAVVKVGRGTRGRSALTGPLLLEVPDVLETHQLRELLEVVQRHVHADARAGFQDLLVDLPHRGAHREKARARIDGDAVADALQILYRQYRREPALDHVGEQGLAFERLADFLHLRD